MGCCCSEEEDPRLVQYRQAKSFATKARLVLAVAGDEEKRGRTVKAIELYGTHLRCMAVHCFKEFDRSDTDELINVAQACRRIATHRASLQQRAIAKAQQSCCSGSYIPTDPAAPALLEPWEWGEWLHMCKTGGDIEAALMKMGLIKMESSATKAMRLASATRSNVSVALSQNVSGPSINVSPTIAPHISPHIVSSNAQTGEGNVTPAVGSGGDLGGGGGSYAAAPAAGPAAQGAAVPLMSGALPGGFLLVPGPQGGYMLVPTVPQTTAGSGPLPPTLGSEGSMPSMPSMPSTRGSSGDYAALSQALLAQQQQQLMQQYGSASQPLYFQPGTPATLPPYVLPSMPSMGSMGSVGSGTLPPGSLPPTLPPLYSQAAAAEGPVPLPAGYVTEAGAPSTPHLPPDGYVPGYVPPEPAPAAPYVDAVAAGKTAA